MKNSPPQPHILLSRTDNIGDVILTLPMAYLLKQAIPDCQITFLARDYVKAIIDACPAVDGFLSWDMLQKQTLKNAIANVQRRHIDIAIHVFPRREIAKLLAKAGISWRIGTSHRWYHFVYCNQLVNLNRKNAKLHEAQLNLALLTVLGITAQYSIDQLKRLIKLSPIAATALPKQIHHFIDQKRFNLIVHPLSNNNGKEWPLEYYQTLILALPTDRFNVFITGAPNEVELLKPLINNCPDAHAVCGQLNLNALTELMWQCDGLVAGSTGPLHMASALGIKTLGLYPPAQTMNPQRWAPIGEQAEYLVTTSHCHQRCLNPQGRSCACMKMISVNQVTTVLLSWDTLRGNES